MKRAELLFSAILVPVDYLMIVAAGLAAYRLRFWEIASLRPVVYELPFSEFLSILLAVAVIWLGFFALSGLYAIGTTRRFVDEFAKIFLACSTGVLGIIVLIFFQRELFSSRFIILAGWVAAIFFVSLGRLIVRSIQRSLLEKGFGARQVCVVGSSAAADQLVESLSADLRLGQRVVSRIQLTASDPVAEIQNLMRTQHIDEVILADPVVSRADRMKLLDYCNEFHVVFKYASDLLDAKVSNIRYEQIAGQQLIEIMRTPLDGWGRILKRVWDVTVSAVLLVILSPVFLLVAIAVKVDSPGPVFFGAVRVGEGGRTFKLYKFRSMIVNAQAMKQDLMAYNERPDGPLFKMKNDPRVTRVGRFIRRTSLDELPQFFNAFLGNMSLVGPRPHEPEEVNRYRKEHRTLLAIKPGVTGLAQISGRSDLNFDEEARLDIYYIEHWSPWLDLKILFRTPWAVLTAKSAS